MWSCHCTPRLPKVKTSETALSQRKKCWIQLCCRMHWLPGAWVVDCVSFHPGLSDSGGLGTRERGRVQMPRYTIASWVLTHRQPRSLFLSSFPEWWCPLGVCFSSRGGLADWCLVSQKDFGYRKDALAPKRFIICQRKIGFKQLLLSKTL